MRDLIIDNFSRGQQRDGALLENELYALRTLLNCDIIFTDGRLRVRPGYERWNAVALPDIADQIYMWVDLDENEHMLALCGGATDRWYLANEAGAHLLLMDEYVSAPVPVVPAGNRLFAATDSGWYWMDDASLTGSPRYYRVGILPPGSPPNIAAAAPEGNFVGGTWADIFVNYPPSLLSLNDTDQGKMAAKFTLSQDMEIQSAHVFMGWRGSGLTGDENPRPGAYRLAIYDNDTSGAIDVPGDIIENASSNWGVISQQVGIIGADNILVFGSRISLSAGTEYWMVLEPDDAFYDSYEFQGAGNPNFYPAYSYTVPAGNDSLYYHRGLSTWVPNPLRKLWFFFGGLTQDYFYDYIGTYYNSEYGIESRPSAKERVQVVSALPVANITVPAPLDSQVDRIRVYRREVGADGTLADDDVVDEYKLVGEYDAAGGLVQDTLATGALGAVLQTEDHYAIDENDALQDGYRPVEIVPHTAALWKGRVWIAAQTENIVRFSKILEENGATGIIGDSVYDYFPFENRLEIPSASAIIGIYALSEDQLAVYMRNEEVWLIWGADEALNPPSDIAMRQAQSTHGLFPKRALDQVMNSHVYLSAQGLKAFAGSQAPVPRVSSETNQSLLDAISGDNLRNSVLRVLGDQVWCLVDLDDDGDLETVLIMELTDEVQQGVFYRPWKMYRYDVSLKDLTVRPTAAEVKTMFASDGENAYILKLNTGTTDNASAIDWEIETHDLRARNMASVVQFEMDAYYPGTPPQITATLTSHDGDSVQYTLTPESSDDIRNHRKGTRLKAPVSVRIKVTGSSVEADEILSILARYIGE